MKVWNMKVKENAQEEDPRSRWEQQVMKEVMHKEGRNYLLEAIVHLHNIETFSSFLKRKHST
jgi:hypothetical protein